MGRKDKNRKAKRKEIRQKFGKQAAAAAAGDQQTSQIQVRTGQIVGAGHTAILASHARMTETRIEKIAKGSQKPSPTKRDLYETALGNVEALITDPEQLAAWHAANTNSMDDLQANYT